jgi:hypothetical protein
MIERYIAESLPHKTHNKGREKVSRYLAGGSRARAVHTRDGDASSDFSVARSRAP